MRLFRRLSLLTLVAAALLLLSTSLFGGSGYNARCTDAKCGYEGRVNFGGGFFFNQLTGYCTKCEQFVYLRWPNGHAPVKDGEEPPKVTPPAPLGTVWNPTTGKTGTVYPCPKCTSPFLAMTEPELKCCPKCRKPTLELQIMLAYD